MRGTDCTEDQIRSANDFMLKRYAGESAPKLSIDDTQPVTIPWNQLVRVVAWYGALRFQAGRDGTGGKFESPGPID